MANKENSAGSSEWSSKYNTLLEYHDQAYKLIDNAISLTNEEKYNEAIESYENGLSIIDKALQINIECPYKPDFTFEKACSMIQKMKKVRKEILGQIAENQTKIFFLENSSAPPSYEEAMSTSSTSFNSTERTSNSPLTYAELGNMLENLKLEVDAQSVQNLFTCENVSVYYIFADGTVSANTESDVLRIFQLEGGSSTKYYLQIGTYLYPLVPKVSPCYRSDYGALLLPNVNPENRGEVIGLIYPPEYEDSLLPLLESLLNTKLKTPEKRSPPNLSLKISEYITSGANKVSDCLVNGAHKAEQFFDSNTPKLIDRINPSSKETVVSPKVVKGVKIAKNVTAKTADITGFVASKVGTATMFLGKYLAPHVKKGGTKLLSAAGFTNDEASRKIDDIFNVTAGAVEGFSTVYQSLEYSAVVLGNSLTNNTVHVVKHKYGTSASKVTEDTFHTVGNSLQIANNIRVFKGKSLIKTAASATIREFKQTADNGDEMNGDLAGANSIGKNNTFPVELISTTIQTCHLHDDSNSDAHVDKQHSESDSEQEDETVPEKEKK